MNQSTLIPELPHRPSAPDLPTTRAAALEAGSVTYRTGKPCVNGHICPRWTRSYVCVQCQRDYQREYAANPICAKKVLAYHREYRRLMRETLTEQQRQLREKWTPERREQEREKSRQRRAAKKAAS